MRYGWILKKKEWKYLVNTVLGTKWKRTNLNKAYRDGVPETSGVYVICTTIKNISINPFQKMYNAIYVGKEGVSLRRRFLEHCRPSNPEIMEAMKCFNNDLDYWFAIVSPDKIDVIESCLIECLGPSANRMSGSMKGRLKEPIDI